jgi:hypothetical protein
MLYGKDVVSLLSPKRNGWYPISTWDFSLVHMREANCAIIESRTRQSAHIPVNP